MSKVTYHKMKYIKDANMWMHLYLGRAKVVAWPSSIADTGFIIALQEEK